MTSVGRRAGGEALRPGVRGVRGRLRGAARRRAPRVRAGVTTAGEGPGMGAPRRATSSSRRGTCATTTCRAGAGARPSRRSSRTPGSSCGTASTSTRSSVSTARCSSRCTRGTSGGSRRTPSDSDFVYRSTITAKTCDTLRVCLPAATRSNVGIYATAQSYEQLLMRLSVHPLAEMREYGALMLEELRKVIPAFLKRVDVEDRGVAWARYWRGTREGVEELAAKLAGDAQPEPRDEVTLVDFDPEGEVKVAAAVLYASTDLPDDQLLRLVRGDVAGRARGAAAGERRGPVEPAPQARTRVGAHRVPLRRAVRLRGVPGPAATPSADDRVAAPDERARARRRRPRSTRPGSAIGGTA